jgi:hypothetical protein
VSTETIWEGPDVPRPQVQLFHHRFGPGGIEETLEAWIRRAPRAIRPLLRLLIPLAKRLIVWLQLHRTMLSVDAQAAAIGRQIEAHERTKQVESAIAKAKELYPGAQVERVSMPKMGADAVAITHPPRPEHPAEMALGFSEMRIAAPWTIEQEHEARG